MAQQTRTFCSYCKQMIWTINNNITPHYQMCPTAKQITDHRQSSVKEWEIKEMIQKSKDWRESQTNAECIMCHNKLHINDKVITYLGEYVIHKRCEPITTYEDPQTYR